MTSFAQNPCVSCKGQWLWALRVMASDWCDCLMCLCQHACIIWLGGFVLWLKCCCGLRRFAKASVRMQEDLDKISAPVADSVTGRLILLLPQLLLKTRSRALHQCTKNLLPFANK